MSRSGYYKWLSRDKEVPKNRARILALVDKCHKAHKTHGYRWVHAKLSKEEANFDVSPEYVRKCFHFLGIEAQTKHKAGTRKTQKREQEYPNLIYSTWETVDRPRQVIVSDMTAFWTRTKYHELALYFDVFTKEIVGHAITCRRGFVGIYYDGVKQAIHSVEQAKLDVIKQLEIGCDEITIIHTDQGSVYTSKAYNEIIKEANIVHSCSRPGKPTDNPVNESLNGWIKEELIIDFDLYNCPDDEVEDLINDYVEWYNCKRPCWSLGYKTPKEFYNEYMSGKIEQKDTFANRVLDETPKFLREKLKKAEEEAEKNGRIGTSDTTYQ